MVPTQDPALPANFEALDRVGRLTAMERAWDDLDERIRRCLPDMSVEFLSGASTWVVRSETPIPVVTLRQRLAGVPVRVADDERFSTS